MKDVNELQTWFVERVANYLKKNGKEVIVWDDVLDGHISSDLNVITSFFKSDPPFIMYIYILRYISKNYNSLKDIN